MTKKAESLLPPLEFGRNGLSGVAGISAVKMKESDSNNRSRAVGRLASGRWTAMIPAAVFAGLAFPWLWRDLWFDEALTVMNFAVFPPLEIYRNYAIPNNHIVYSLVLHFWLDLLPSGWPVDVWIRLFSMITGIAVLAVFCRMRIGAGRWWPVVIGLALAAAPPVLTYGTAARGYMLGAGLVLAALAGLRRGLYCGSLTGWLVYAASSALALGAAPTNLAALAGAALLLVPRRRSGVRWSRLAAAGLIPLLAGAAFYLPIVDRLLAASRLGEGWPDPAAAAAAWSLTALISLAVFLPAALGIFRFDRRRLAAHLLIWLLPLVAYALLPTAPFPRVFFPCLPVLGLALAREGFRWGASLRRRCRTGLLRRSRTMLLWGLTATAAGLISGSVAVRSWVSPFCGGAYGDDFFSGYYLQPDFTPSATAGQLVNTAPGPVYLSFNADPWAVSFYARLMGMEPERLVFNSPRVRVTRLTRGWRAVLRRDEDPEAVGRSFQCRLIPESDLGFHRIYRVE